jgi:F-type H+-transporting ATPase subunit b
VLFDVLAGLAGFIRVEVIEGYPRILDFDIFTVIDASVILINVAFIIFILSWLLYKPVLNFLNTRKERIENELKKAADDMQNAAENRTLYEGKLKNIAVERDDILEAARKLAGQKESEIIEEAGREATLIMDRAKLEIEREKEKAKEEMRVQIIQISSLMAERLLGGGMDAAVKDRLLNEAITELGDAVWKG